VALYPGPTTYPGPESFTGAGLFDAEDPTLPEGPAWWPSTNDVAQVMARLTTGTQGTPVYTFTEDTVPTRAQAEQAIDGVAHDVANSAGTDLQQVWTEAPTGVSARAARRVIALGAASQLAFSYYPGRDGDIADRLEARYVAALERLLNGGNSAPDTGSGGDGPAPASPVGGFPPPAPGPDGPWGGWLPYVGSVWGGGLR